MAGHPTIGSTFALALEGDDRARAARVRLRAGRRSDAGVARVGRRRAVVRLDDAAAADVRRRSSRIAPRLRPRSAVDRGDLLAGAAGPGRLVRRAVPVRADRARAPRSTPSRSTGGRWRVLPGRRDRRAAGLLLHARSAPATAAKRSTAGCWRRDSASPRIPRPAAPAVRSALPAPPRRRHADAARSMLSLQGVAMGRPSRIHISIDSDEDRITRVRVGGRSVLVGRGEISLE